MSSQRFSSASKISVFSKDIEYVESKIPEPSQDFVTKFKENSGARKDYSNRFTIDVLPNFVPILTTILYHVNQYTPLLEASKHAKISAGTFTAYCLTIIYGYILCCDLYVRDSPSMHAIPWEDDARKQRFVEFLHTLPVPDFVAMILHKLTPTTSEHRGNISFVPSAAGFTYDTHFGRFFPLNMFTNIHDLAAELPSNTNPAEVNIQYLSKTLFKFESFHNESKTINVNPAHFLGTFFNSDGNYSTYNSKLEQIFQTVFNPVLFRDYQRRQTLASVSIVPVSYNDEHINFYDLVFSATSANLAEYRIVFQSIAGAMKGVVKCPGDLASFFKSFSGTDILRHGYSYFALPTWHHSEIKFPESNFRRPSRVNPANFATAVHFLQAPTAPKLSTFTQPKGECQTDSEHKVKVKFETALNRLSPDDITEPRPDLQTDFVTFSESLHLFPKVYVFSPSGSTIDAWDATAFGMVIENTDIDGTVVAFPNTELSLGIENTWFADSSIPYYACYKAPHINTEILDHPANAMKRTKPTRQTRFPAASLLVDRTSIILPRYKAKSYLPPNNACLFPGLTPENGWTWATWALRFLGFHTADPRLHGTDSDKIPGFNRELLLWSPFSYTGYEGDDDFVSDFKSSKHYFITNLRTLFGTDIPLIEVSNGLESMPIS
uniref:Coat protein n=1 Tax=Curvularia lunata partitivirus 2 TaxID=2592916 RepID=A0A514CAC2_9VIRU|nr:coat protein [Curvularia lunata partitivirus 2]